MPDPDPNAGQGVPPSAADDNKTQPDPAQRPQPQPPGDSQQPQDNEAAKFRRLHEKAAKELETAQADLKKFREAQLSDLEKAQKRAEEAETRAKVLELERTRLKVAQQHHLTAEATELLDGVDEAQLTERAEKLARLVGQRQGGQQQQAAPQGSASNPPRGQQASVDEQIEAASKAGNLGEVIRLKRERAFGRRGE